MNLFAFVLAVSLLQGSFVERELDIEGKKLELKNEGSTTIVTVKGFELDGISGEPLLPQKPIFIWLPEGAQPESVKITGIRRTVVAEGVVLKHAQPPAILPIPGAEIPPKRVDRNAAIYSSPSAYPSTPIKLVGCGRERGNRVAELIFYPVIYYPATGRVEKVDYVRFRLYYSCNSNSSSPRAKRSFLLKVLALNPRNRDLEQEEPGFDYLIITSDELVDAFRPLVEWKRQKGLRAEIRTVSWITSHYPGRDTQEKIRNYLKIAYQDSSLKWVLLGGDVEIVPARIAFAMCSEAGYMPDEDSLHADLYYADLDGTWDVDGDGIFGEIEDSVDLYPELFVGRAPVRNADEAEVFVQKVITYEKTPTLDYLNKALFFAEILWHDPYTDSGVGKDLIDSLYVPDRFQVEKLYESLGNENKTAVMDAINAGKNLMNHGGHGFYYLMGVGENYLMCEDMDALSNGDRLGILYSIGCWVGAFDYDAISEHFIRNPEGGGVAFIGNSRYGWGSPGNPGYGYSFKFDKAFYKYLLQYEVTHIGEALALAKAEFIPYSRDENVYRWHQYQLNLLGDPEMEVWIYEPEELTVLAPDMIPSSPTPVLVSVLDGYGPVWNANVAVTSDGELLARDVTGPEGKVILNLEPGAAESLNLTVTFKNHLPFEKTVYVDSLSTFIAPVEIVVADSNFGNGDGLLNAGERAELRPVLVCSGSHELTQLELKLRSLSSNWQVLDSVMFLDTVQPGDTVFAEEGFEVLVAENAVNADPLEAELIITAAEGTWTHRLTELVAEPVIRISRITFEAGSDTIPEPGEDITIFVTLKNEGLANAPGLEGIVSSQSLYLVFPETSVVNVGLISAGDSAFVEINAHVSEIASPPRMAQVTLTLWDEDGDTFESCFGVLIGRTGFFCGVEDSCPDWVATGHWHRTDFRSHSGSYSWYCGIDTLHQYANWSNDTLLSPWVVVGVNPMLTFWHWFEATTYGCDGFYVMVYDESGWHQLDYIGSGGALDSILPIGNDWAELSYTLSSYEPGDSIRVAFIFVSDGQETAEGVYIDDIEIGGTCSTLGVGEESVRPSITRKITCPTLVRGAFRVQFNVPSPGRVLIDLFDVAGRRVQRIFDHEVKGTKGSVMFSPENLPSGSYFIVVKFNGKILGVRKIVLLR